MGSPCLFMRQQALKMGYFYWLCVKNSNHLHAKLSLGYWEDAKFYIESKASFIGISSIASFKLFLIAWLREYCTFRAVPWLAWGPHLPQNAPSWELFSPKKSCSTMKHFFFFKYMCFTRLLLENTWKNNRGSPRSFKRKLRRNYFAIELSLRTFEENLYVLYVHALICAR